MTSSSADYRRGVIAMSLSMAVLLVNDSILKLVTQRVPSDQIIFVRGLFVSLFILVWLAAAQREAFRYLAGRGMLLAGGRGVMDALASFAWVASLLGLPLANGTAITLSGPLILTGIAILFLKERVGWRHWAATLAGLGGVVMIIQPSGSAFNWFSLLALLSAIFSASRDAVTRSIGLAMPSLLLTLATGGVTAILSGLSGAWRGWPAIAPGDILLLACAGVAILASQQLTIYSLRVAEASAVAPFRYTSMLWAMVYGFLLWGDVPNLLALAGIVVVVASGLYLMQRERAKRRVAEGVA